MKKTYMIPTLQVVKIQPAQFIATSDFGEGTKNGSEAAGRSARFSNWEEEE